MEQVSLAIGEGRALSAYKTFTNVQHIGDFARIREIY
jgi:hypothetical protein